MLVANNNLNPIELRYETPEKMLVKSLVEISEGKVDIALKTIDALIKQTPNFKLAYLIQGDLLLAHAKQINGIGDETKGEKKEEVENLKNEAKVRIERYLNNLNLQNEPKIFAQLNDKDKYLFYVDAGSSRLYLYENIDGKLSYKDDFYVSIGKNGFGKQYEGDKKTPVGVYFTGKKIRESLSDFYGEAAYPLSYPNEIDIKNKRNGSGIWLHGTPKTTYNRAPLASDGCIVLSNPDLMKLSSVLDNNKIPIIISFQSLKDLESSNKNLAERKLSLINAIERWREKWEDQDTESYLKFYSKNFFSQKDNYDSWAERKRIIQAQKQKVFVGLSEISFFDYPNTENEMVLVDFIQDYKSPTINNKMNKRQYWINENNEWRIMYEGGA
ncbi:L,D-transpeptidase family protein [Candidatus Methylopumilus universalis]|jgi:murein L,D-transpeptidase YafK|nr:L,D-transpeptidase family protein [Candidatus Methylopumilus universalis]MBP6152403.1 L,D-transpeptidase family protein [Candidatus Methylopumilus sp.]MBP7855638.1 L,D-transpeptidase family protein [Candidatus Methylopumilus sp.]